MPPVSVTFQSNWIVPQGPPGAFESLERYLPSANSFSSTFAQVFRE